MKSSFSYYLPALSLLAVLALPLTGCDDTKGPGAVFKDCDTCPEMVVIPSGSFKKGDLSGAGSTHAKPVREVTIGAGMEYGIWIGDLALWRGLFKGRVANLLFRGKVSSA